MRSIHSSFLWPIVRVLPYLLLQLQNDNNNYLLDIW